MNTQDLINILKNSNAITNTETDNIKSVIDEFPYFQSARAVYLKGLKHSNSFNYNLELKSTAAYTTNRTVLFNYITSDNFIQNHSAQPSIKDDNKTNESTTIEVVSKEEDSEELIHELKSSEAILDPDFFLPKEKDNQDSSTEKEEEKITSPSETLNIGQPLEFDKNERHSFSEWLNLTQIKPIQREENIQTENKTKTQDNSKKARKFELIDKFITKNPKIEPSKTTQSKVNLANAQMIQPEELMTETLARIYVEQKNYKSAIQSYKILSLKYPEKSSFFASQIEAVKQLQEQNNKL